jgi:hypothetical protein
MWKKYVEGDGKLKESSQRDEANQKHADVRIVPGTSGAGI